MAEKESPVAGCSYATNSLEIGATDSSNFTSVSEDSASYESDAQNPNEKLLKDVEIVKEDAEIAMKEMRWIIDSLCEPLILRWRDAEKSAKKTLKRAKKGIREANDDEDPRFQSQHVAQIFVNACSSARSEVKARTLLAEGAYSLVRGAKEQLEMHAIQHGMVNISMKFNGLKGAISYKNVEARNTLNSIADALEDMKKCYEYIGNPEFLHERFEGRDPRIASQSFCRRARLPRVVFPLVAIITLSAGVWTTHEAVSRNNILYALGAVTCFSLSTASTICHFVAPMRLQIIERRNKFRKEIEEIEGELAKLDEIMQNNRMNKLLKSAIVHR